jgi:hypothetical protein
MLAYRLRLQFLPTVGHALPSDANAGKSLANPCNRPAPPLKRSHPEPSGHRRSPAARAKPYPLNREVDPMFAYDMPGWLFWGLAALVPVLLVVLFVMKKMKKDD